MGVRKPPAPSTRSGNHPVLVDEAAQAVRSSEPGRVDLYDRPMRRVEPRRCPLVDRAVRAVGIVVLGEYDLQVTTAEDEHPVEARASNGAEHALADGVGRGAGTGVLMMLARSAAKTASRQAVNLVSRSRMWNLISHACSEISIERLRAWWVTQAERGSTVTPVIRTTRVSWWMNTNTSSLRRRTVSTSKKHHAIRPFALAKPIVEALRNPLRQTWRRPVRSTRVSRCPVARAR